MKKKWINLIKVDKNSLVKTGKYKGFMLTLCVFSGIL